MFKRENLRKNFLRVKQNIDQNLGRAEQSKVLTEDQQENEKRVDTIKHVFQNITKKASAVLQASGPDVERRLKKLPETALSHALTESAQSLGTDTLLGNVCQICGDCQMSLAREQVAYEVVVEQEFIAPLQTVVDNDIPSIVKLRKALNKSILDMDSAKTRLNQVVRQSQVPGANMANAATKADALKDEYEDATLKMENIKDNLSIEMCNFAAKESEHSNRLLTLLEAQANYHRKALEAIEACIPEVELSIKNSPAKPCFGMALEEHLRLTCRDVALVLEACVLTLLDTGMEEEGLFRIAGSAVKLKKLKACFDAHAVDMDEFSSDPHTVAGALKQYLRELPEPLLTFSLYDDFLQAATLPQDQRLQALWTVISRLPKANYNNFRYLVKFLAKLAEKSDVNKMKPSNIAIVVGPNLIWSEKNTVPNMATTGALSGIIEAVVTNADWFFPGALDFHLTGHGSSPRPCREPDLSSDTHPQPSCSKLAYEKEDQGGNIEDEKSKDREMEEMGNGIIEGVTKFGAEHSPVNLAVDPQAQNLAVDPQAQRFELYPALNEDDGDSSADENTPLSEKYEAKAEIENKLEQEFNLGYFSEDGQEGSHVHSERPQNTAEAVHDKTVASQQVTQIPCQDPGLGASSVPYSHTSSSNRPVASIYPVICTSPVPFESSDSSATQKRAARKLAPPPPPPHDKPSASTAPVLKPENVGGSVAYDSSGGGDGVDSHISGQSHLFSRTPPTASSDSQTPHSPEKDKQKMSNYPAEKHSTHPIHRPDHAPPERPRVPASLHPSTAARGHQRSASTGDLISPSSGSFDSSTVAGFPNAGSSCDYSVVKESQYGQEGDGSHFLNSAVDAQNVVLHGSSSDALGRHVSIHPRPIPPPPPPPVARESEYTKL